MPKPLVRGDQTFHIPAARAIWRQGTACQHHLKDMEQLLRNLEIALIASVMERDQDFVGQPPAITRRDA